MPVEDRVLNAFSAILALDPLHVHEIGTRVPIPLFPLEIIRDLCREALDHFRSQTAILEIDCPVFVIGDIHGNLADLIRVLFHIRPIATNRVLFLGDYVDRGEYSTQVVMLLFALSLKYPESVFMLRGNHEFSSVSSRYGFSSELLEVYKDQAPIPFRLFHGCFEWMPICASLSCGILCLHGGISPHLKSWSDFLGIERPLADCDEVPVSDIMWSDPTDRIAGFEQNTRGLGVFFGAEAVSDFLAHFGLKKIIRAHQCVAQGVQDFANKQVYTVFSSSNYDEAIENACGLLYVDGRGAITAHAMEPIRQLRRADAAFASCFAQAKENPQNLALLRRATQFPVRRASLLVTPRARATLGATPIGQDLGHIKSQSGIFRHGVTLVKL